MAVQQWKKWGQIWTQCHVDGRGVQLRTMPVSKPAIEESRLESHGFNLNVHANLEDMVETVGLNFRTGIGTSLENIDFFALLQIWTTAGMLQGLSIPMHTIVILFHDYKKGHHICVTACNKSSVKDRAYMNAWNIIFPPMTTIWIAMWSSSLF